MDITQLKKIRKVRGYNIGELAERAGVNRYVLGKIESGKSDPHLSTLEKIAKALEIEIRILL